MTIDATSRIVVNLRETQRIASLYQIMAHALDALTSLKRPHHPLETGLALGNPWTGRWESVLDQCLEHLPHGSGFDVAVKYDDVKTCRDRIVLVGSYHKMNDVGYYVGWIDYRVTVRPAFISGREVSVVGGNNDFKDYAREVFDAALCLPYDLNQMLLHAVVQAEGIAV